MLLTEKLQTAGKGDLRGDVGSSRLLTANCSDIMQCNRPECSSFGKEVRCWEQSGSFSLVVECPKILKREYASCHQCRIYKGSVLDEFAALNTIFNALLYNLKKMIIDIQDSSGQISGASVQLAKPGE